MCSPNRERRVSYGTMASTENEMAGGSHHSARVKYDEHQELDMAADRYRLDAPRTVLMNCHVHEWQRTIALSAPSHPAAYK